MSVYFTLNSNSPTLMSTLFTWFVGADELADVKHGLTFRLFDIPILVPKSLFFLIFITKKMGLCWPGTWWFLWPVIRLLLPVYGTILTSLPKFVSVSLTLSNLSCSPFSNNILKCDMLCNHFFKRIVPRY